MAFRAIALQKAGRADAAAEAWKRFTPTALPESPHENRSAGAGTNGSLTNAEAINPRHRFVAEAFVSLEMVNEGIEHLRAEAAAARSDADRLSAALALVSVAVARGPKGRVRGVRDGSPPPGGPQDCPKPGPRSHECCSGMDPVPVGGE